MYVKEKNYICTLCSKAFTDKYYLKSHISSVHDKVRFKCDQCEKTFSKKLDINKHKKSFHEGRRFECNLCEKTFIAKISLKNHISKIHNGESPKKIECDQCTKVFESTSGCNIHKLSHQGIRENCSFCDKALSNKQELKAHISSMHSNSSDFLCDVCNKCFTTERTKKAHFRKVHSMKK